MFTRFTVLISRGAKWAYCKSSLLKLSPGGRRMIATVTISPSRLLVDDQWSLVVRDLRPSQRITLLCRLHEPNIKLSAHAHYVSDENGVVDVTVMAARPGGSYDGIEPMGLIWSLTQEPGQRLGKRLLKVDVQAPMLTNVYVLDDFLDSEKALDLVDNGHCLADTACTRSYMADGVSRIPVNEDRLQGTLFVPEGPGPFPGVLDFFGAVVGLLEYRPALLASRGVATLAVRYLREQDGGLHMGTDIQDFVIAVEYLLNHPKVLKPYAGVIGVSKGAENALMLASFCQKIKACVAISAFDFLTMADYTCGSVTFPGKSLNFSGGRLTEEGLVLRDATNFPEDERRPHQIPVERSSANFLLIHGEDDQNTHPVSPEYIAKRLQGKPNHRLLMYPGAGHLIEPPYSPHYRTTFNPLMRDVVVWGGNARQHARAQESAWKEVQHFFKTTLSSNKSGYYSAL